MLKLFYNFGYVKTIDSTIIVAIPAIIFAYFTYRVNLKQTNQIIINQYTEHMNDFFDILSKYENSFPIPQYLGNVEGDNKNIEDKIPNYSKLKSKLLILKLRAEKFDDSEISDVMQEFWGKFLESEKAIFKYCVYNKQVKENKGVHGEIYKEYANMRNDASAIVANNVTFFLDNGPMQMNNAYDKAIRKLR